MGYKGDLISRLYIKQNFTEDVLLIMRYRSVVNSCTICLLKTINEYSVESSIFK